MPSLPIWRKCMGFYYIIKLLHLFTRLFWTLSHWICLKWVHVQLWDMFGIIMLLPGFLYIFPWEFLGMGQFSVRGLWETFWNQPKFSSWKQVGYKVGLLEQPLSNQACFVKENCLNVDPFRIWGVGQQEAPKIPSLIKCPNAPQEIS
jgi:hypothetical protein